MLSKLTRTHPHHDYYFTTHPVTDKPRGLTASNCHLLNQNPNPAPPIKFFIAEDSGPTPCIAGQTNRANRCSFGIFLDQSTQLSISVEEV